MNPAVITELLLVGGGGHCAACIDVIEAGGQFRIAGIIDNNPLLKEVCGYPVLGNDDTLPQLRSQFSQVLITLGQLRSAEPRRRLTDKVIALGFSMPTVVSPRAYVSRHAKVGHGTIIMHDALINARAVVGQYCIINSKALIEHDAIIEDYCHVSTAATVNGAAVVRRASFVGSHATVIETADNQHQAFIKAGSLFRGAP